MDNDDCSTIPSAFSFQSSSWSQSVQLFHLLSYVVFRPDSPTVQIVYSNYELCL